MITYDDVRNVYGDRLALAYDRVIDDIQYKATIGWELPSGLMQPKISFRTDAEADAYVDEMKKIGANEIVFGNPVIICPEKFDRNRVVGD